MSTRPIRRAVEEPGSTKRVQLKPRTLDRLFDDASQFPPGDLSLEAAVAAHARWRRGPRRPWVGRFLLPARRIGAFAQLASNSADRFEVGLVVPADMPGSAASEAARRLVGCADVTAVELPFSAGHAVIAAWQQAFAPAVVFIEGQPDDIAAIGRLGGWPKLRCGGLVPAAVPSVDMVAGFVAESVARGLPFKATAGLHQPLRHRDAELGVELHGFLNLWVATQHARAGASRREIEATLAITDLDSLAPVDERLHAARASFTAFGTCSLSEPIAALVDLGIVHD